MTLQLQPGCLEGLYAELSSRDGADRSLNLGEIVLAEDALESVPSLVLKGGDAATVVIVQDETDIRRAGVSIKPYLERALAASGCEVHPITLHDDKELHTRPSHIATVRAALRPGVKVVSLGSGTVTDIAKHAVFEFEADQPQHRLTLIAVQTANSVVAYTSNQAVITFDKVKRTVASRLPDVLVLDTRILADCPSDISLGGIGDTFVVASSFADYRLVNLLGLGRWEPLSWPLMERPLEQFLACDPVLADRSEAGMGTLALDLAACGLSLSLAGESAPVSGLEHVTSHTLDMSAAHFHRPIGNHGSQCGLATIFTLIAYERLLSLPELVLDVGSVDDEVERHRVQTAFGHLDEDGATWQECWRDYSAKIQSWRDHRDAIAGFVQHWPERREELRRYVVTPDEYVTALAATGHPLRFEQIPTGITEAQARWAFTNARLMRKRTSVADVLGFAGLWTPEFIEELFATYHHLIAPYTN